MVDLKLVQVCIEVFELLKVESTGVEIPLQHVFCFFCLRSKYRFGKTKTFFSKMTFKPDSTHTPSNSKNSDYFAFQKKLVFLHCW